MMKPISKSSGILALLFVLIFSCSAQDKNKIGDVKDFKFDSRLMSREMPYRVIFPVDYAKQDDKVRFPVIYLLHGLTGHFDNWVDKSKLVQYSSQYNFLLVMPEGNDGWYTDSASVPDDRYESYIIQELVPEIERKFRTISQREARFIAGLSMGGYGSLKFALKYPEKFEMAGSFSGALGAASWSVKTLGGGWKALTDSIGGVYGDDDSETRLKNDIYKIVREMTPEKVKVLPFIYLDCGTEDGLIQQNREFTALLAEKKIPHEFRELPGKHDWVFWDAQIQEFLRKSDQRWKQAGSAKIFQVKPQ